MIQLRNTFAAAMVLSIATSFANAAPLVVTPVKPIVWSDFLGVNSQFTWVSSEMRRAQMAKLKELGLAWHREGVHWELMEPTEGVFRYSELDDTVQAAGAAGLNSLLYLVGSASFATTAPEGAGNRDQYPPQTPSVYADRLAGLAERYPSVKALQVWNEQNIPSFWRPNEDAFAYSQLLKASTSALSERAPNVTKVIGGMAYYSQMPVAGGLMLQALAGMGELTPDRVVAYHPYTNAAEGESAGAKDFIETANWLNAHLRQHGIANIWATEFGWSSYPGPVEMQPIVGESGQADLTLRRVALMSAMDFNRVFLFTLADLDARATVRDRSYGLLREDGSPKPVYTALKRFLSLTGPSLAPGCSPAFGAAPASLIAMPWKRSDGKKVLVYWANETGTVRFSNQTPVTVHDPMTGASSVVYPSDGNVSLTAGHTMKVAIY